MNNMVGLQFENVRLQADVEVLLAGLIFPGKVKWKGVMSGRHGSWIGIELRRRIGVGNGCYKGVQYFGCADGYGIFVRSSQLRFPPTKGRSYSSYRRISNESSVDNGLFGYSREVDNNADPTKLSSVSNLYALNARSHFPEKHSINGRKNYHLGHPIGSTFASGLYNSSGPFSEQRHCQRQELFTTKEQGKHFRKLSTGLLVNTCNNDSSNKSSRLLISPPSIPRIHSFPSNVWI